MFVKGLRKFLYAGALLALAPIMARAEAEPIQTGTPAVKSAPAVTSTAAPCATTKVRVCEMVSEPCEYTRTTYRSVPREETYTVNKWETVVTPVTKQVTVMERVCETVNETRTVTKRVPVWEDKIETVSRWKLEKVTEMKEKTVRGGHFECCTVPAGSGILDRLCGKCPDPCATKTVKKWVSDCHTECVPVCRTKLVKVCEQVCKKVCTYQCVTEQVTCPVTKVRCVPVQKTITVNECKKVCVPTVCKRTVNVCEPVTEVVKGCRMVPRWVEKEVPVTAACGNECAPSCGRGGLFSGLRGKFASKGGCGTGCGAACGAAASCCN